MFAPRSKNTASWLMLMKDIRRYGSEVKMVICCPQSRAMLRLVVGWSLNGLKLISFVSPEVAPRKPMTYDKDSANGASSEPQCFKKSEGSRDAYRGSPNLNI